LSIAAGAGFLTLCALTADVKTRAPRGVQETLQIIVVAFAKASMLARTSVLFLVFSFSGWQIKNYGSVAGKTDDAVGATVSLTSWRADWEA
jgi:hypothetical protein